MCVSVLGECVREWGISRGRDEIGEGGGELRGEEDVEGGGGVHIGGGV